MRKACVLLTVLIGLMALPAAASALNFKPAVGSPLTNSAPDDVITATTTGNFNSDIYDDVAAVTSSNKLFVWLTQSDGTFQSAPGSPYALNIDTTEKYSMWAQELTNDYRDDLIIQSSKFPGTFYSFFNNGFGAFPANPASEWAVDHTGPPNYRGAAFFHSTTLADLTGDGCPDLLVGMFERSFQVGISNCAGGFTRATSQPVQVTTPLTYDFDGFTSTAVGDYNGDGDADIALMLKAYSTSAGPRIVYVMHGNGSGLFGTAVAYYDVPGEDNSSLQTIETINQDDDVYDDLLVLRRESNSSDTITSLLGSASGLVPNPAGTLTEPYRGVYNLAVADFDDDEDPDYGVSLRGSSQLRVALGDGVDGFIWDDPFDLPQIGGVNFFPNDFHTPDLNADGYPDVLTSSSHSNILDPQARGIHALISKPAVSADHTSIAFPETPVGQRSAVQTVTLTVGLGPTASFTNSDFSIEGPGDTNYDLETTCPGSRDAGETCTVEIYFDPSVEGEHHPELKIDLPDGTTLTIPLHGVTGHEEVTFAHPDGIEWVTPYGYAMAKEFEIESTGTWPTKIEDIMVFPADEDDEELWVVQDFNNCKTTLQPGQSCKFEVYFEPTNMDVSEADVVVFNETDHLTRWVTVTGFGTQSDFSNDQGTMLFDSRELGSGPSAAQQFKITPTGSGPVPFGGPVITGPDAASFKVTKVGNCPAMIQLDQTCTFAVVFEPQGALGDKEAKIEFDAYRNFNTDTSREIELFGTATEKPVPPPPSPDAKFRMKVKSAKKVVGGKKLLVTASIRNVGNAATIAPVSLKATSPKKSTRAVKAQKIARFVIGQSVVRKFRIPVKKNAKGKFKVKLSLSYNGHTSQRLTSSTPNVKIQKPKKKKKR